MHKPEPESTMQWVLLFRILIDKAKKSAYLKDLTPAAVSGCEIHGTHICI
jgi:hypothetical protein